MIVLRVVLEDLLLLRVLPSWDGLVELGLLPPLLALDEHLLGELDIELAGAEETELNIIPCMLVNACLIPHVFQYRKVLPVSKCQGAC